MKNTIKKTFTEVLKDSSLKEQIAAELHGIKSQGGDRKLPNGFNKFFESDSEVQPLPDGDY